MKSIRVLSIACALLAGCAPYYAPGEVEALLHEATAAAAMHLDAGEEVEAGQLLDAVLQVEADRPEAAAHWQRLDASRHRFLFDHPLLGSNMARRHPVDRSVAARVFLYLPDRILDALDTFSFDVHIGWGTFVDLHVTRAVQLGLGGRGVAGLGWHDHRSLGALGLAESEAVLPAVGAQALVAGLAGTSGVRAVSDTLAGLHRPSAQLYQSFRDYWAVGFAVTAFVAGVDFDIHPVEMGDFLVGFSTVDFLHDDFARSRGLSLSGRERDLLWRLGEVRRSEQTMADFAAVRGGSRGASAAAGS